VLAIYSPCGETNTGRNWLNNSSSLAAGEGLMSGEIVDPKNYRQGCHPNQPDDLELSLNFPLPGCHIIRTHCPQFSENDNKRPY
jgi:hypothetical protein